MSYAEVHQDRIDRSFRDAITGAVLAEAATRAASRLVEINVGDRRPDELPELVRRAAAARELALHTD